MAGWERGYVTRWVWPHSGHLAFRSNQTPGLQSRECRTQGLQDGYSIGMLTTDLSRSPKGPYRPYRRDQELWSKALDPAMRTVSLHQADESDARELIGKPWATRQDSGLRVCGTVRGSLQQSPFCSCLYVQLAALRAQLCPPQERL